MERSPVRHVMAADRQEQWLHLAPWREIGGDPSLYIVYNSVMITMKSVMQEDTAALIAMNVTLI